MVLVTRKRMLVVAAASAITAAAVTLVYTAAAPTRVTPVAQTSAEPSPPSLVDPAPAMGGMEMPGSDASASAPAEEAPPAQAAQQPANPNTQTKTITYGPFQVPAAVGDKDGRSKNIIELGIETPCGDCFITRIKPDLAYADGSVANVNTGPGLHHFLLTNQFRQDPICGQNLPNPSVFLGERFAAAGNERTDIAMPTGYGYYNDAIHRWNMATDFMNHAEQPKTVYIKITYDFVPGSQQLKKLRPVWLDVAPCSSIFDTYKIPAGGSTETWDWTVNVPGRVIGMGGHIHMYGVAVKATDMTTGNLLCDSVAGYGETAMYINPHGMKEVSSMSTCRSAESVGVLAKGDKIRLTSTYQGNDKEIPDAMGIMVTYIEETP